MNVGLFHQVQMKFTWLLLSKWRIKIVHVSKRFNLLRSEFCTKHSHAQAATLHWSTPYDSLNELITNKVNTTMFLFLELNKYILLVIYLKWFWEISPIHSKLNEKQKHTKLKNQQYLEGLLFFCQIDVRRIDQKVFGACRVSAFRAQSTLSHRWTTRAAELNNTWEEMAAKEMVLHATYKPSTINIIILMCGNHSNIHTNTHTHTHSNSTCTYTKLTTLLLEQCCAIWLMMECCWWMFSV